jgi:hypothetical protein
LEAIVTMPVGAEAVPVSVSVTVAVQLDEPGSANAAGVQTIVVSVARLVAPTETTPLLDSAVALPG